jgi:hypothetical protein
VLYPVWLQHEGGVVAQLTESTLQHPVVKPTLPAGHEPRN